MSAVSQFIPEDAIQEVLLRVDIVEIISDYVALRKSGANYVGLCPFHHEKTPSFTVSPTKGLFYCFGCQASGNVFRFLMRQDNLLFPEAVRLLADRYGVRLPEHSASRQQDTLQQLYSLHQAAATFFHQCLLRDSVAQQARAYCRQRQITQDVVTRFQLGYAPDSWDALWHALQHQRFAPELLVQSGLVVTRENHQGVYDRFRNRLIFPIHDRLGRPVAFGGRTLEGEAALHTPKYLNSPETPIFHKSRTLYGLHAAKHAIRQEGRAIMVEGYTDVLACHRQGAVSAVGTLGTALTEHHVEILRSIAKEVILLFDGDAAGSTATERGLRLFLEAGMRVRVVELPAGEDPDSFLQRHTGEEFRHYIEEAMTFLDYQLARAKRFYDLQTPAGQADCVARILPLLRKIDNRVEQWGYVTRLAEKLGVPVQVLQQELSTRAPMAARGEQTLAADTTPQGPSLSRVEYDLLRLVMHDVPLLAQVQQRITPADFQEPQLRDLYTLLLRVATDEAQTLFPGIHERAETDVQRRLLAQMAAAPMTAQAAERQQAVQDYLQYFQRRRQQQQLRALKEQLREAERCGDTAAQQRLLQEYTVLSKERRGHSSRGAL
jgi:DNA primase